MKLEGVSKCKFLMHPLKVQLVSPSTEHVPAYSGSVISNICPIFVCKNIPLYIPWILSKFASRIDCVRQIFRNPDNSEIEMSRAIVKFVAVFIASLFIFMVCKAVFLIVNFKLFDGIGLTDICAVLRHGLSMDMAVAGYMTFIPGLLFTVALAKGTKGIIDRLLKVYFLIISIIAGAVATLDSYLYSFWLFKLDVTPFFYFFSSPSATMASIEPRQYGAGLLTWFFLSLAAYCLLYISGIKLTGEIPPEQGRKRTLGVAAMTILTLLLFIPIRGGFTVSTMNPSRAYFSNDTRLNHAAVNPLFSLLYSASHQDNPGKRYRYMNDDEAREIFYTLTETETDSLPSSLIAKTRPDIYIIILESFSSHLFPSLGGEQIATRLDSIAREGLLFSNIYASGIRTDRGIPAILSAYPALPSSSIMKYVRKSEHIPSLPKKLKDEAGYRTTYYYGGDINFTNMNAYLVSAGFDRIISDRDFSMSEKLSKWGANDKSVFEKAASELSPYNSEHPQLKVIQTSSSHEPFDVDYDDGGRFNDKRAKAFAYADHHAAEFINRIYRSPAWNNTLILLVPDHYGAYPEIDDPAARHRIPMIMTGGVLNRKGTVQTVGAQIDAAATLLSSMGLKHSEFPFSHDIFNSRSPHFAFFSSPSYMGFITDRDTLLYDLESDRMLRGSDTTLLRAKAYLQTLSNDFSQR